MKFFLFDSTLYVSSVFHRGVDLPRYFVVFFLFFFRFFFCFSFSLTFHSLLFIFFLFSKAMRENEFTLSSKKIMLALPGRDRFFIIPFPCRDKKRFFILLSSFSFFFFFYFFLLKKEIHQIQLYKYICPIQI